MSPLSPGPRALFRSRERYGLRRLLDVVDGTPRWAVLAAYGTVVSVLPSAVWRTAVGFGADLGMPHVIGAVVVTAFGVIAAVNWETISGFRGKPAPGWYALATAAYAPALCWGPLLLAVTWAYWRRRRAATR